MAYSDNFQTALADLVTSLTAADLMDYNRMVFEKMWSARDVRNTEEIITGVRNGAVLPILKRKPQPDAFPFTDLTNCDVANCSIENEYSSHTWETAPIECRVPICLRTFSEDFHKFWNTCRGAMDLDSALLEYISKQFIDSLYLGSFRVAYFADKASSSPLYNKLNGIFTQMGTQTGNIVTVTQNAGASYATQAITGAEVYDLP